MCEEIGVQHAGEKLAVVALPLVQDDVRDVADRADDSDARAAAAARPDTEPKHADDSEVVPKKRKTRRGKSKRQRNVHPYRKNNDRRLTKMVKAEAPYNSNRFLLEDHGDLESIDEELKKTDQASTSTVTRTRDSSFSMDSDGEFYSTPDDEEVFLIKDFDDQYESLQAERLQGMSKDELIKEYLMLEGKVELLTQRLRTKPLNDTGELRIKCDVQKEIQRLTIENDALKRENDSLRSKADSSSDSADSETDSSDTCSSTTSSLSRCESPVNHINSYEGTNGHCHTVENEQEQAI